MSRVTLDLTTEQAQAVDAALDLYTRICLGQIDEIADLIRMGVIPAYTRRDESRQCVSNETTQTIETTLKVVKTLLGHPANGSFGIGSPHVAMSGRRTYEIHKVLAQALAVARDPSPGLRGVDYDGLGPRYTDDPAPIAKVDSGEVE
jgi:predicted urease superfamily metal-dependent hydrolase